MSVQVICFSWKTAGRPYKVQREKGGGRGGRPLLRGAGARKSREKAPSCVQGRRWGGRGSRAGFPEEMDPGWEQESSELQLQVEILPRLLTGSVTLREFSLPQKGEKSITFKGC